MNFFEEKNNEFLDPVIPLSDKTEFQIATQLMYFYTILSLAMVLKNNIFNVIFLYRNDQLNKKATCWVGEDICK